MAAVTVRFLLRVRTLQVLTLVYLLCSNIMAVRIMSAHSVPSLFFY